MTYHDDNQGHHQRFLQKGERREICVIFFGYFSQSFSTGQLSLLHKQSQSTLINACKGDETILGLKKNWNGPREVLKGTLKVTNI